VPYRYTHRQELPAHWLTRFAVHQRAARPQGGPLIHRPEAKADDCPPRRLLGLGQQQLRVTTVANYLLPLSRLGFVIAAVTGVLMFLPGANLITERGSAPWKLGLLLVAGLNVLIFHRRTYRSVSDWDLDRPAPASARTAAVVSLTAWTGVTVAGSLLAYT
jgi:hypothetical protein